jgi:hypothetical protein
MVRAAVITLLFVLFPSVPAQAKVPRGWIGVVADGPLTDPAFAAREREWDRLAGSGADNVRTAFFWPEIQPNSAAETDFSRPDAVVLDAARRGLGVLPVVQGAPDWAALSPGDPGSPPRDPADFARLLTALVTRYGPNGSFWTQHPEVRKQPIRAWQIWNEPNITRYWNVAPWAPSFTALLKAADAALKAADPGAETVLAGLTNESWTALAQIYAAGGGNAFDVVTLHPYTKKVSNVRLIVELVRKEMRRHRDARMPIWMTELSWPASLGITEKQSEFAVHDKSQAANVTTVLDMLADARRRLRIERVYWYTWLSAEASTGQGWDYSGLRRLRSGKLVSAPALKAYERAAKRLTGCTKRAGDARRCR